MQAVLALQIGSPGYLSTPTWPTNASGWTQRGRAWDSNPRTARIPFTIEGRQVHEAYLVMSKSALVGFYLSGESRYSNLPTPIPLPIGDVN